jgi:hypothetical protein
MDQKLCHLKEALLLTEKAGEISDPKNVLDQPEVLDTLMNVKAKRQILIRQIEKIEKELSSLKGKNPQGTLNVDVSPLVRKKQALIKDLIQRILQVDQKISENLGDAKVTISEKLESIRQGRMALSQYRPFMIIPPRFFDRQI